MSEILPPHLRKTKTIAELIPWLYLKGISTGDMSEALAGLAGASAAGLSPSVIAQLKSRWEQDYKAWEERSLEGKRYLVVWADGIYFNFPAEYCRHIRTTNPIESTFTTVRLRTDKTRGSGSPPDSGCHPDARYDGFRCAVEA